MNGWGRVGRVLGGKKIFQRRKVLRKVFFKFVIQILKDKTLPTLPRFPAWLQALPVYNGGFTFLPFFFFFSYLNKYKKD